MRSLPFRGTLLNTATVLAGSLIGMVIGSQVPEAMKPLCLSALGVVSIVMGMKMALAGKDILVAAIALVAGGIMGLLLALPQGVDAIANGLKGILGGGGSFNDGLITASVLFCIGPMTLLGCIEDGLEGKIEILALKSTLDFVASLFLAVSLGSGVVASAIVVLVFQGALTASARFLKPVAERPHLIRETSAVGGLILLLIGLNLLDLKKTPTEAFLPSLILSPILAHFFVKPDEPAMEKA